MANSEPPRSGTWRGRYISALGFSRTAYFALDFKGDAAAGTVTGRYFTHLFIDGERVEGSINGTYSGSEFNLTASAPETTREGVLRSGFNVALTFVAGQEATEKVPYPISAAAYGVVRGSGDSARYSGVLRMRYVDETMHIMEEGWIDTPRDEG